MLDIQYSKYRSCFLPGTEIYWSTFQNFFGVQSFISGQMKTFEDTPCRFFFQTRRRGGDTLEIYSRQDAKNGLFQAPRYQALHTYQALHYKIVHLYKSHFAKKTCCCLIHIEKILSYIVNINEILTLNRTVGVQS